MCVKTKGFCVKKDGTNIECECPASQIFETGAGCKGKRIHRLNFQ